MFGVCAPNLGNQPSFIRRMSQAAVRAWPAPLTKKGGCVGKFGHVYIGGSCFLYYMPKHDVCYAVHGCQHKKGLWKLLPNVSHYYLLYIKKLSQPINDMGEWRAVRLCPVPHGPRRAG